MKQMLVTSGSTKTEEGNAKGGQLFVIKNTGAKGLPGRGFSTKVKNPSCFVTFDFPDIRSSP